MPVFPPKPHFEKLKEIDWTVTSGIANNVYEEVLDVEEGHELYWIRFKQTNDESANKGGIFRIDLDGITFETAELNFTHNTWFYVYIDATGGFLQESTDEIDFGIGTARAGGDIHIRAIRCQHLKIRMKIQQAPGTNQRFDVDAWYSSNEVLP